MTNPTYLAMATRKAWSDDHLFEATGLYTTCGRCYMPWNHPNHVSRDEDKAEVLRRRDRIAGE